MGNSNNENEGYPSEIIGYAEPWIVAPGESVAIKVSTSTQTHEALIVEYI
jgi:hypothetical protein